MDLGKILNPSSTGRSAGGNSGGNNNPGGSGGPGGSGDSGHPGGSTNNSKRKRDETSPSEESSTRSRPNMHPPVLDTVRAIDPRYNSAD